MNTSNIYDPLSLKVWKQWLILGLLLSFMAVSRTEFIPYIPDASWTVFFLIGFYFRSYLGLLFIILAPIVLDFAIISAQGGHQDYYLTPSYLFIIPAYSILWFAGRFFAERYSETFKGLLIFFGTALLANITCDLISSGGFFWVSSYLVELEFGQFIERTIDFMPIYLKTASLYLSLAALTHMSVIHLYKLLSKNDTQSTNV